MISPENYVLDPINADEMDSIEQQMGRKIPSKLRNIVSKVGFLQNAIGGNWPQSTSEFIEMQESIPAGHVAFMNDGAGNYYVVSPENTLLLWDHEMGELVHEDSEFTSFINEFLRDPEPIDELSWHVQMAFDATDDQVVLSTLSEHFDIQVIVDWKFKDTSPAGVSTYLLQIKVVDQETLISKQIYDGWGHDIYYLNMVIPINEIAKHKDIFKAMESNQLLKFKLVNYGIMPTDLGHEDEI
jgi:hypothetical protein